MTQSFPPAPLAPRQQTNWGATVALVLGIAAFVVAFIPVLNVTAIPVALAAVAFAIVGFVHTRHGGLPKAIVGLALALLAFIVVPSMNAVFFSSMDDTVATEGVTGDPGPAGEDPLPEVEEPETTTELDQAVILAEGYLDFSGFSRSGLIDQLEYEKVPAGVAEEAIDSLGVDWDYQAERLAADYVEMGGFSQQGLVDQLVYEGFTADQAEHGAKAVFQ